MTNNYKSVLNSKFKSFSGVVKSSVIGTTVGIVVVAYRLMLIWAEEISISIYAYVNEHISYLPVLFLVLTISGYFVGNLVAKFKMIAGSGIPQVKGIIMGYFKDCWYTTLLSKFIGGSISILAGLSLGREGPSIQLGACVAQGLSYNFAKTRAERKILIASGASAGLAAAFNAPLAGVMFVMEEIFKYFSPTILLTTIISAVAADVVSKSIFGLEPVFHFDIKDSVALTDYWLLILLGLILGVSGYIYNYLLIKIKRGYSSLYFLNTKTKPIIPFILAGVLGLCFPIVLGGGHKVIACLSLDTSIGLLASILMIKFVFSMLSFASGAPGGIFFPLLIMGALIGAIFGNIAIFILGYDQTLFYNFVILAMAGLFTAIVRAPITGVILLMEMTGSFKHLLSLTIVSIVAYIVADYLKSKPIYDSLLELQVAEIDKSKDMREANAKVSIEIVVHHGSKGANRLVKDILFIDRCLLVAVRRESNEIIPNGNTKILAEDYLLFLTDLNNETAVREFLKKQFSN